MLETAVTPGTARSGASTLVEYGDEPSLEVTTMSDTNCVRTAFLNESWTPLPRTATNETSVIPIISAAAVEAVRAGDRVEFRDARPPATPPSRRAGDPTTVTSATTS